MTKMICTKCGSTGKTKSHTKGSILIELVLWLCFLVPGLIYSLWRLTTRRQVCAACGSHELAPVDSPIGRKLARELAA